MKIRLSAMAIAFAWPSIAPAAEMVVALAETVVTATRQEARANEVMASVEVIDRETIEQSGQSSITDLLSGHPGIRISTNGGPGASSSIFMRGAESRHTLVLVDGMRINTATTGQPSLEIIPLASVERIEILRGPASFLYGSEAIGGVIQIFTRRGVEGVRPELFVGVGSNNTREVDASVAGGSGRLSYSLGAGYTETDGINSNPDPVKQPFYYQPDRDGYRNTHFNASASLGFRARDEIGATVLRTEGRNRYDAFGTDYDAYLDKTVTSLGVYMINELASGWTSTLRVGASEDSLESHGSAAAPDEFRTRQRQFMWQHDVKLPLGSLLAAYEHLEQKVDGTTAYTVDSRHIDSLLLGWGAKLASHFVQANLRHDDNSQFGGKTTGHLGYGYQLSPEWRARASISTAFNAPTFNQLYWPDTGFGGGNPDLKPEKALNREVGLNWERGVHAVSLTYYNNKVRDLIAGWPPANVNKARLEGVEIGYSGEAFGYRLAAGADFLDARNEETDKRLPRRGEQAFYLKLSRQQGPWNWGMDWNAEGRRYDNVSNSLKMGGYALLDAFVHYRFSRDWRIEARANNLLDKRYETAWGYGTEGRNVFVGLRYTPL